MMTEIGQLWHEGLDEEQRQAGSHLGSHACLLAGPGTGKTLVMARRVVYLVGQKEVAPARIIALTFTRAAAYELRQRVRAALGEACPPRLSTLHSFALRQLLRNPRLASDLPEPIRIADDWEERWIIDEDLKRMLGVDDVREVQSLLNRLSADWPSLVADERDWKRRFPHPELLDALREHRAVYRYLLRKELVYRLRHALEQHEDFVLDGPPEYILVDEYQDLNRCDLAVIAQLAERGAEIFAAGDDDQSVYGFRGAYPEGIRRFELDYPESPMLSLATSKRCDPEILNFGLFIARQDYRRYPKDLRAEEGRPPGNVHLLRFREESEEAKSVAAICHYLINRKDYAPHEILVLLRRDRNGVYSQLLEEALQHREVPVTTRTSPYGPLDTKVGRTAVAFIRLFANPSDHLAWRTLLQLRRNNLGPTIISLIRRMAAGRGEGFAQTLGVIEADPDLLPRYGRRVAREVTSIRQQLVNIMGAAPPGEIIQPSDETDNEQSSRLLNVVRRIIEGVVPDAETRVQILDHVRAIAESSQAASGEELVRALSVSSEDIEQEIQEGKVNIMTMHKAKGLTAKAVLVVGAEDELIPGRHQTGPGLGDERRLLYVSVTRAMHDLFITFCERRTGAQRFYQRFPGRRDRSLTQFLDASPYLLEPGRSFVRNLLSS